MLKLLSKIADNVEIAVKNHINDPEIGQVTKIGADGSPTKIIDEIERFLQKKS